MCLCAQGYEGRHREARHAASLWISYEPTSGRPTVRTVGITAPLDSARGAGRVADGSAPRVKAFSPDRRGVRRRSSLVRACSKILAYVRHVHPSTPWARFKGACPPFGGYYGPFTFKRAAPPSLRGSFRLLRRVFVHAPSPSLPPFPSLAGERTEPNGPDAFVVFLPLPSRLGHDLPGVVPRNHNICAGSCLRLAHRGPGTRARSVYAPNLSDVSSARPWETFGSNLQRGGVLSARGSLRLFRGRSFVLRARGKSCGLRLGFRCKATFRLARV